MSHDFILVRRLHSSIFLTLQIFGYFIDSVIMLTPNLILCVAREHLLYILIPLNLLRLLLWPRLGYYYSLLLERSL